MKPVSIVEDHPDVHLFPEAIAVREEWCQEYRNILSVYKFYELSRVLFRKMLHFQVPKMGR